MSSKGDRGRYWRVVPAGSVERISGRWRDGLTDATEEN
jgi:hypothetical protein